MQNISVDDHTHKDAKTLCKALDLTLGELVKHCVVYVKKTGIDPSKDAAESPHKVVKELERRIGQLVAFIKNQEQDKLNPLLQNLILLQERLEDILKELPTVESFKSAKEASEKNIALLVESHKRQMDLLKKSQEEMNAKNQSALNPLTKTIAGLIAEQNQIKSVIETKLGKKMFA